MIGLLPPPASLAPSSRSPEPALRKRACIYFAYFSIHAPAGGVTAQIMKQGELPQNQFNVAVGIAALIAPALHSLTDVMEWSNGGFSTIQLWLNYLAFLPMPWLLLGLYAAHEPRPNIFGLIGALLYGAAFTYFAHTTLYALTENVSTYEALWSRLGDLYTFHGALMVLGGLMFAWSALRVGWLPGSALWLFAAGIIWNLLLALLPAPDILQTIGSAARNIGLMAMGHAILFRRQRTAANIV